MSLENRNVIEYELSKTGLGTTIGILSMLLHSKKSVLLHVPASNTTVRDLKQIFNITDEQLQIVTKEELTNDIAERCTDQSKFYSPYLTADFVNLFRTQCRTGKQNKPCIGLSTWNLQHDFPAGGFPYHRLYPREFWVKVTNLLFSAGYDVISLNSNDISLEQKIYMMNELCDGVISYEGGIAHLAHSLKIPCVILPWHRCPDGAPAPDDLFYAPHRYHIDSKTWFVQSGDELLSWSPDRLKAMIDTLNSVGGNHLFRNRDIKVDSQTLQASCSTLQPAEMWANLSDFERSFITTHIQTPSINI
jgi:hypothetical protein